MSNFKVDLDEIKSKIILSSEIEKKTKLTKKGNDYWCCCIFHTEKTPSMKINDELGTYYCFGCGAKGDVFNLYTDFYNYTFQDAVNELAGKAGIVLKEISYEQKIEKDIVQQILEISTNWYIQNLNSNEGSVCRNYLKKRNLSQKTIEKFRLGYSFNSKISLYEFLKSKSYKDKDIFKSNVVKLDNNSKPKDYFYKRLIFPILNESSKVIGFGGRSLDNTNPKYINSPESNFFQKRFVLYNLYNAKKIVRQKKNILICEGYMDVISLFEKGIHSVVAPLGTALTEQQLFLAWKYCNKPTIMFDGDSAGVRAAYKTALMSLEYISPNKLIQFILIPSDEDPDSFINKYSFDEFIKILQQPISLVYFIFFQAVSAYSLKSADDKILFDKFIDDIIKMIKDSKVKYFYKNEFKTLFFEKIKNSNKKSNFKNNKISKNQTSLLEKQLFSYLAAFINHPNIRIELRDELIKSEILNHDLSILLKILSESQFINKSKDEILDIIIDKKAKLTLEKCIKTEIYQLFPYASPNFGDSEALFEIKESSMNLKTRLLNLKKINKSLDNFHKNTDVLNWEELQKISKELID